MKRLQSNASVASGTSRSCALAPLLAPGSRPGRLLFLAGAALCAYALAQGALKLALVHAG